MSRRSKYNFAILLGAAVWLLAANAFAGICFLPDCEDQVKPEADNSGAEKCRTMGYESDKSRVCPQYTLIDYCPENSNYIKCDYEGWCRLNGYVETTCESPYKLTDKCLNGTELYKECLLDDEAACKQENPNYVSQCDAGWALDPNKKCSISGNWGLCCNTCPGYNYTAATLPEGATAVASCDSCWGKRYIIADSGFNQCKGFWDCQDGCEIGSETCVSFGVTKCKTCKRCEAKCSNLTCPPGALCEYENCTQRYCEPTGCATGYTNFCEAPQSTDCADLGYNTTASTCVGMGIMYCPFDANKVYCIPDNGTCCMQCKDFPYQAGEIPAGYVAGNSCTCCGQTFYKAVPASCPGFVKKEDCEYGLADGATSCKAGDTTLYSACKQCPNACPENSFCPTGASCTYDACSKSYCVVGCDTHYTNYCNLPNTNCWDLGYTMTLGECALGSDIVYCPFNNNYVYCAKTNDIDYCEPCKYYPYKLSEIPSGYLAGDKCECPGKELYQAVENPCTGFVTDDDCDFGTDKTSETCKRGTQTTYKSCQECERVCHKYCPYGMVCEEDSCSKTQCVTGCATNYTYFCNLPDTNCRSLGYVDDEGVCAGKQFVLRCPFNKEMFYCE